jgi:uncharacterized membrane protein
VAIIACTLYAASDRLGIQVARVFAAVAGWFVVARAFYLLLGESGMESQGALTASWTLYAALILTLGFVLKEKPLRMTSFALFGVTIAKVFLIDLAELDDLIKVIVLVLLGFVLIAGGYIYVRLRQAADAKAA